MWYLEDMARHLIWTLTFICGMAFTTFAALVLFVQLNQQRTCRHVSG